MDKIQKIPWIEELVEEIRHGGVSRRDFLRYASLLGISAVSAGVLVGLTPRQVLAVQQEDWQALGEVSPFEIKNLLLEKAHESCQKLVRAGKKCKVLNAGRGNPDFLNVTVRQAFALLTLFAAQEAGRLQRNADMGLRVGKRGLAGRLSGFAKKNSDEPGGAFLQQSVEYILNNLGIAPDEAAFQLVDGIQGDFYPDPPRILPLVDSGVSEYIKKIVFSGKPPAKKFKLFATEGATAAMVYLFKSLQINGLLNPGDSIAIVTPIFSPYLEIPVLPRFNLKPVYIKSSPKDGWQIPPGEMKKLKDKSVKALFLVNPANPASVSLDARSVQGIANIVKNYNRDMVVISDTVYASFVDEFHTLAELIPENILGAYSFSKYFGVTGWRLGVIMVFDDNVVDGLIKKLPKRKQALLDVRYRLTSTQPASIPFLERLEIDSRNVALAHTGGLSTPQQIIMLLFSVFELLDRQNSYKKAVMDLLCRRWQALFKGLQLPAPDSPLLTRYYALLDVRDLIEKRHGGNAVRKLERKPLLEFLLKLAGERQTVCLPGDGFAGPAWSLRVALANLSEDDCGRVGKNIVETLDLYVKDAV